MYYSSWMKNNLNAINDEVVCVYVYNENAKLWIMIEYEHMNEKCMCIWWDIELWLRKWLCCHKYIYIGIWAW